METREYLTPTGRVYRVTAHGDVYREDGVQLASCRGYMGSVSYLLGGRRMGIARIVLSLYVSPPPSVGYVAIHRDRCSWNNHYSNLAWATPTERNLLGLRDRKNKHLLPPEVKRVEVSDPRRRPVVVDGFWYVSVGSAAKELGLRGDCVSRAARGCKNYKGMSFNYIKKKP